VPAVSIDGSPPVATRPVSPSGCAQYRSRFEGHISLKRSSCRAPAVEIELGVSAGDEADAHDPRIRSYLGDHAASLRRQARKAGRS